MKKGKTRWFSGVRIGQLAVLLLALGAMEFIVRQGIVGKLYLSEPTEVLRQVWSILSSREAYMHIRITLTEFLIGFSLAAVLGIGTGMLLVLVRGAEVFFRPFLSALMAVPKVTIIPLIMLWIGMGITHKVVVVFLFCYFTIAFNTITGIKQTADNHLKVAKVLEATRAQTIWKVILPSAAPTIFAGLRVSAATGLVGALFGEMIASQAGLGNLLVQATSLYDTAKAFAIITIVTVLSVLIIWLIDLLEKKVVLRWKAKA
ncbi:ABC transporter permease [Paenibacillaceae bacterium]|nr:ABC transporter permease [Paenibacillaceae bacterium]